MSELKFHMEGWNDVVREIIDTTAVPMAQDIADACNQEVRGVPTTIGHAHFMAGTEGDESLALHDYRATVITATAYAMRQNAKYNTLIRNMSRGVR